MHKLTKLVQLKQKHKLNYYWFQSTMYTLSLKAIIHFRNRKKIKSSQIYKQHTGFTEGNGKRLLLKYYSMKCFTFWGNAKTIINSRHRELRIYSKHVSWHGETRVGFPVIFPRLRGPIEPKFSQVCDFIYTLWYTKYGPWTILFTENVHWL